MNWNLLTQTNDLRIEFTGIVNVDNYFYKWEKNFIKITMLSAGTKRIVVNGTDYDLYLQGEYIIIEITDQVRATEIGYNASFDINYSTFVYTVSGIVIVGSSNPEFKTKLPKEIPFNKNSVIPFNIQLSENMKALTLNNTILEFNVAFNVHGGVYGWDWVSVTNNSLAKPYLYTDSGYVATFVNKSCWTDKILVEWISAQGWAKSWWFEIDRLIHGSDKELDLQTLENGYYTLKNKRINAVVKHRQADISVQRYLSDLILSDEVYVYDGTNVTDKIRVKIDNNAFEVTKQKRDIQLTINKLAYDTI